MRRDVLAWVAVIGVAALVAHACGYAFGVANQTTYLLQPLHRAHPELYTHDWLVTSTTSYHTVFTIVASWLFQLDDIGSTAFAIVHVVLMLASLAAVYVLVTGVTRRDALPVFVLVAAWLSINGVRSLAGSYLWACYLQPSTIATAAWLAALALYVRGRPLATGVALALGGLFHVNFLVLGIGMFGLAELVVERDARVKRLALLVVPQLVALVVLLPELFAHATGADSARALWVLTKFHAPVHYNPHFVSRDLLGFVRWGVLAIVVAPIAYEFGDRACVRRLLWWATIAAALCAVQCFITRVPALLPLTRLYVWRLAPFSLVGTQIVIVLALAATLRDPAVWRGHAWWRPYAALVLAAWLAARLPFTVLNDSSWVLWGMFGAIAIALVAARLRGALLPILAGGSLAVPLAYRTDDLVQPSTGVFADGLEPLYAWARTSTPVDAVFMINPDLFRFRLIARRAIIADFKSPPLAPDGLVEWHQRLSRMVGVASAEHVPDARKHWAESTGDELLTRARDLGADYLIVEHSPAHDRIAATPVFAVADLAVYAAR